MYMYILSFFAEIFLFRFLAKYLIVFHVDVLFAFFENKYRPSFSKVNYFSTYMINHYHKRQLVVWQERGNAQKGL